MTHALSAAITERMDELGLRQRDVVSNSGLSRALVSKYVNDDRDKITRLPSRATLEGLARGLRLPVSLLLAKAVESLDLGYIAGDFVNSVADADDSELLVELAARLQRARAGEVAARPSLELVEPTPETLRDPQRLEEWLRDDEDEAAAHDEEVSIQDEQEEPDTP